MMDGLNGSNLSVVNGCFNATEICSGEPPVLNVARAVALSVTLGAITITTIAGNVLVVRAFTDDKRIRSTVANTFILNLSICDLIVGAVSLPLNSIWIVLGWWPFGKIPCQIWLALDYTSTNVAVWTVIYISLDRYWLLTKKLAYGTFQTHRRAAGMNAVAWAINGLYYTVVAFAWGPMSGSELIDYSEECELEPYDNSPFVSFELVTKFLLPLLAIIYINAIVYSNIKLRSKALVRHPTAAHSRVVSMSAPTLGTEPIVETQLCDSVELSQIAIETTKAPAGVHLNDGFNMTPDMSSSSDVNTTARSLVGEDGAAVLPSDNLEEPPELPTSQPSRHAETRRARHRHQVIVFKRHRKAAITLSVLVGVFVVAWVPFYISSLVATFCEECVSDLAWEIVNYVLWCNSTVNPFLYALLNIHFRKNFKRYLHIRRR